MDPEKNSLNFIFPTKYVIPKSLKFSHWLSELNKAGYKSPAISGGGYVRGGGGVGWLTRLWGIF